MMTARLKRKDAKKKIVGICDECGIGAEGKEKKHKTELLHVQSSDCGSIVDKLCPLSSLMRAREASKVA